MGMVAETHKHGTFEDYANVQPDHVQHILGTLYTADVDTEYWIDALNKGLITIVTNGSVANHMGYYATAMHTDLKQLRFQCPCDGAKSLMTSYCTELAGILAALYLLRALSPYSQTQINTKQTVLCINAAVVSRANRTFGPGIKHYTTTDYDIAKEIGKVKKSGLDMQISWVNAHQDNTTAIDQPTLEAQLNVHADTNVTSFCLHIPLQLQPSLTAISHQSTKAIIKINNTVITANLQQWIQDNYLVSDILRYRSGLKNRTKR
eukprot:4040791-Ditylum_brightwellii.AAC.1